MKKNESYLKGLANAEFNPEALTDKQFNYVFKNYTVFAESLKSRSVICEHISKAVPALE